MKPFPLTDGYAVFSQLLNELLKGALLLASCISYRVFMRLFKRGDYSLSEILRSARRRKYQYMFLEYA